MQIIWKSIGIGIMALMLIGAMVAGYELTSTAAPCISLRYTIEDADERMYLTEGELNALLRAEGIYPVGQMMNAVSLHRIERSIGHHPMVRTAECYITPRNEVWVQLTQRVPLLRIQTPHEHYIIDTDRRVMQARAVVKDNVPVVVGNISPGMATSSLSDFAEWLQSNRYWRKHIHHLYVQNPYMIYVYLCGEEKPRVVMGTMRDYEHKFAKLRAFIEDGADETSGQQYRELDLRFKGQVVARK